MKNKIFISYARSDQEEVSWIKKLKRHLGFFERKNTLKIWDDSKLKTGDHIKNEIINAISESKIAVLLIGPGFLSSDFINEIELPKILEKLKLNGLIILPLITNFCPYEKSDLREFLSFNPEKKPLESLKSYEQNEMLYKFCNELAERYTSQPVKNSVDNKTPSTPKLRTLKIPNTRLTCCTFLSCKNEIMCSGFNHEIFKLNLGNQSIESIKTLNNSIARNICQIPDSRIVLISYDSGDVFSIKEDLTEFQLCFSSESSIFSMKYNDNINSIISTERNGDVKEWIVNNIQEIRDGDQHPEVNFLRLITSHSSNSFMFSYDSKNINGASVGADGIINKVSFSTGKIHMNNYFKDYSLYCLAISRDGSIVIGANLGKVLIIDNHDKKQELIIHSDTVRSIALTEKGEWLFTGSKDKTIKLTNLKTQITYLLYTSTDYIYELLYSSKYNQLLSCDGSGTIVIINFDSDIDTMNIENMNHFLKK